EEEKGTKGTEEEKGPFKPRRRARRRGLNGPFSSPSGWICRGWTPRTCRSWKSSACLPKRLVKRRTVLRLTPHKRAVARAPVPSVRCRAREARVSSEVRKPNRGVLARSEKSVPQVAQRRQRMRCPLPDQPCTRRLPAP